MARLKAPAGLGAPRSRLVPPPDANPSAAPRASARARGYSTRWDKASRAFLARHPLCLGCEAVGRTAAATLTDHVVPHKGDAALFWDRRNWQPSCDWHHNVIKQRLEREYAAGRLAAEDLRLDSAAAQAATRRAGEGG